jgi:hypothetical protein
MGLRSDWQFQDYIMLLLELDVTCWNNEVVLAKFEAMLQYFHGGTEEDRAQDSWLWVGFKPGTSQI